MARLETIDWYIILDHFLLLLRVSAYEGEEASNNAFCIIRIIESYCSNLNNPKQLYTKPWPQQKRQ